METHLFICYAFFITFEFAKSDGLYLWRADIRREVNSKGLIDHFGNTLMWLFMSIAPYLILLALVEPWQVLRAAIWAFAPRVLIYSYVVNYYWQKPLSYIGTTAKWDKFLRWQPFPVWFVNVVIAAILIYTGTLSERLLNLVYSWL